MLNSMKILIVIKILIIYQYVKCFELENVRIFCVYVLYCVVDNVIAVLCGEFWHSIFASDAIVE